MAPRKTDCIYADVLFVILSWLPVQTLLVCRSVSKSWKETIDSTSFVLDHLANQRPRLLLQNSITEIHLLDPSNKPIYDTISTPTDYDFRSEYCQLSAVSTTHGVICLYDEGVNLFLWNPSIHRHMRIPMDVDACFKVAAERSDECYNFCAFWMDPCTREFKVVIFSIRDRDDHNAGCLFSSRHQKWRKEETAAFSGEGLTGIKGRTDLLINGVVYWIVVDTYQDRDCNSIVYYDFGMERLGKISLAEERWTRGVNFFEMDLCKWDWEGSGCLSIVIAPVRTFEYQIWALRGGSWSKMVHVVGPTDRRMTLWTVLDRYNALAIARVSNELLLLLYAKDEGVFAEVGPRNDAQIPLKYPPRLTSCLDFVQSLIFPPQIKYQPGNPCPS